MDNFQLVLASGSPRRIEIMRQNGVEPIVMRPEVDERIPEGLSPQQSVMYLALKKALSVEGEILPQDGQWLIAADTVVYRNRIMGKPQNEQQAWETLRDLRGKRHQVITGVALIGPGTHYRRVFCESTAVYFKDYGDEVIRDYIASGEGWDKAGGYAIQGGFAPQVDHIEGDRDNVIGFPWSRIVEELVQLTGGRLDLRRPQK